MASMIFHTPLPHWIKPMILFAGWPVWISNNWSILTLDTVLSNGVQGYASGHVITALLNCFLISLFQQIQVQRGCEGLQLEFQPLQSKK
jgi:hypothetical protein